MYLVQKSDVKLGTLKGAIMHVDESFTVVHTTNGSVVIKTHFANFELGIDWNL